MSRPSEKSHPEPAASIQDLIGGTPLVWITALASGIDPLVSIFVKLRRGNPGDSVKDRTAFRMIQDAEDAGLLRPTGCTEHRTGRVPRGSGTFGARDRE